jgi:hypothetical protein
MSDTINTIITSILTTTPLVFLIQSWLNKRLEQSIEHEYSKKLEAYKLNLSRDLEYYKNDLKSQNDRELENLRSEYGRNQAIQSAVLASSVDSYRSAYNRRLDALDSLWKDVAKLRTEYASQSLIWLDTLNPDDYSSIDFQKFPDFKPEPYEESWRKISPNISKLLELKPFISERIYALCFSYWSLLVRIKFQMTIAFDNKEFDKLNWLECKGVIDLISLHLDGNEISELKNKQNGRFLWLCENIEQKIISAMRDILTGKESADMTWERSQETQERAKKIVK